MLVRMILTRPASPEAVLTQLVISTSLALVAESSEGTNLARVASNRVIDVFNGRHSVQQRQPHDAGRTWVGHEDVEELV